MRAVGVVIPAHNEAALLERCLSGMTLAVEDLLLADEHLAVVVVVVLDSCTDGSLAIAQRFGFENLIVDHGAVGAARRAGVEVVSARLAGFDSRSVWLANTDADSCVPAHWLREQVRLADRGADLIVGTVRPDPTDLTAEQFARWSLSHPPGEANAHVHGANLGVRLSCAVDNGGFPAIPEHEDARLVERLRAAGVPEIATDDIWVLTSGRFIGRSPAGYAHHLAETLAGDRAAAH